MKVGDLVLWNLTGEPNDPGAVCLVVEAPPDNNVVQLFTSWGELYRLPADTGFYGPHSVEVINESR